MADDASPPESGSPVKRTGPSLEQLAARYHKDRVQQEEGKPEGAPSGASADTPPTQNLRRLGLAGRIGNQAETTKAAPWGKSRSTPSLNEIRARLNQRGVDVTESKWKKGSSPTKGALPLQEDEELEEMDAQTQRQPPEAAAQEPAAASMPAPSAAAEKPAGPSADVPAEKPASSADLPASKSAVETAPPRLLTPAEISSSGKEAATVSKSGARHPLQSPWTLYYDAQSHQKPSSSDQYESKLKCIGYFTTVESFFDTFATLHRPSQLGRNTNYHLFKSDIKPMWEDPANAHGGRWVLTLREQANTAGGRAAHEALLDRSWMWLVFGLIGEHFDDDDQVTGAVCSLRAKGDRIALWLRAKEPVEAVNALGEKLLALLELHEVPNLHLEFSVNAGPKGEYMSVRHGPAPGEAPAGIEKAPALGTWLDSEMTLHPTDHAWFFAQQTHEGGGT